MNGEISLRFYNVNDEVNAVKRSAKEYGFDDLVIVPYVRNDDMAVDLTSEMLSDMGLDEDTVFEKGFKNLNYTISTIRAMYMKLLEIDEDNPILDMLFPEDLNIYVVTTEEMILGATAILVAGGALRNRFGDTGYVVVPLSINEMLVSPYDEDTLEKRVNALKAVNESEDGKFKLSDKAYVFKA